MAAAAARSRSVHAAWAATASRRQLQSAGGGAEPDGGGHVLQPGPAGPLLIPADDHRGHP